MFPRYFKLSMRVDDFDFIRESHPWHGHSLHAGSKNDAALS